MELKGLVTNILEKRSGTSKAGNAWVSQDYVIEIEGGGNYPRHMCFSVFGEDRIREFAINLGIRIYILSFFYANQPIQKIFCSLRLPNGLVSA